MKGMDSSLGSITQKLHSAGNNKSSSDLSETFIRKRMSSPNPISSGKLIFHRYKCLKFLFFSL